MSRHSLLIASVIFVMALLLAADHREAQAQPRSGPDTIRFMAAVNNHDGTGLIWCVSQTWHGSYPAGPPSNPHPPGPQDALDEVSQSEASGCDSNNGDLVDLTANGSTGGGSNCTISSPCPSLIVRGTGITYPNNCTAIEADLYDYATFDAGTGTGDWKGKQRMLHALPAPYIWTTTIYVAWSAWYFDSTTVGTIVDDSPCLGGARWTNFHVHQDLMPPTASQNCQATWQGDSFPYPSTDWQKQNPDHYVHSLVHSYGVACVVPGPDAANWLLRSGGGELDDTGAGTRQLAETGQPIQAAYTCFTQSSWCGIMTVSKDLLVAAKSNDQGMSPIDYFHSRQQPFPPTGVSVQWYGPDSGGYRFQVSYDGQVYQPGQAYGLDCRAAPPPNARYTLGWRSSVRITCQGIDASPNIDRSGSGDVGGVQYLFSLFRGVNGVNPSVPPTPEEANAWVLSTDWVIVKARVDAVIRAARNQKDMQTLGITWDLGNSFDGKRW